ncbi:two-component system regulatory protein YycI [Sporosarcina sp.]|uniref:two-component system regulatory protein YycI n=1 Tax=Sporosarcina sp. TaxID=49982 RepID=UPI00260F5590|nr:two-component system regulatory protein YycI [Sporosarcina sp.]
MDWNRTKTIFIIVFSILNIFLYSMYVNRQVGVDNMQVIGKTSVEELLQLENITYNPIPFTKKEVSYLSAHIATFSDEELKSLTNQSFVLVEKSRLLSHLKKAVKVKNEKGDYDFEEFLTKYVLEGSNYVLWDLDEDEQQAVFFQRVKNETIFYSPNAMLVVHWDDDEEITHYEQRLLHDFVSFNHKKDLLSQDDAVGSLVTRGYLKPDSTVIQVKSGYSTLVQLTETQVFAPTWNIQVKLKDGAIENYFINAIEGKVIEFQPDLLEEQTE